MSDSHPLTTGPGRMPPREAALITARVTRFSVGVALILTLAKLAAWWVSGSVALLSSLADSGLDLLAALSIFVAVRYAAAPADNEHRYGHGKAESLAGIFQAVLVLVSAVLVAHAAIRRFITPREIEMGGWAMAVMVLSIVLTLFLVRAQNRAIAQTGSVAVAGDRAHYYADLAANLSVIIGIAGAMFTPYTWIDPAVGLGVALWLAWSAREVIEDAWKQLLDHELSDDERRQILALAKDSPDVLDVHELRTRASGPLIHIQFHMSLPKSMSLVEAHKVMVAAENRILAEFPAADVLIHPDPKGAAEPHGNEYFRTEKT